jgi:hypothetical protein
MNDATLCQQILGLKESWSVTAVALSLEISAGETPALPVAGFPVCPEYAPLRVYPPPANLLYLPEWLSNQKIGA